jgi:predicted ATP-binding protein involved in virulence
MIMANYKEKIATAEAEILQLQNRAKEYKQKLKAQQNKERTRRICQRGGYIEKVLPETIGLMDEVFREFIDRTLVTEFSRKVLDNLKIDQEKKGVENGDRLLPPQAKITNGKSAVSAQTAE